MGLPPLDPRGSRNFAAVRSGFRVAYSEDMATAVVATLAAGEPALNNAFNIAMEETVTVEDYLAGVQHALEASGCPYVLCSLRWLLQHCTVPALMPPMLPVLGLWRVYTARLRRQMWLLPG